MAARRSGSAARARAARELTPAKRHSDHEAEPISPADHSLRQLEQRVEDNLACVRQALAIVDLVLKDARITRRDSALPALHAQLTSARAALLRTRNSAQDMREQLDGASEEDPAYGEEAPRRVRAN